MRRAWLFVLCAAALPVCAETFVRKGRLLQVGPNPSCVVAADLNDDGFVDIVTADRGELGDPRDERPANDEISVLMGEGAGEFMKLQPALKSGFAPYDLAIANIDALKWPEIIAVNFHDVRNRDVSLFLNIKPEKVFKPVEFTVPDQTLLYVRHDDGDSNPLFTKPALTSLDIADINGDGLRDLVATAWASDVLVFMPGHVETHFGPPRFFAAPGGPREIALADLDGDKALDAAVVMQTTGELALFRGDGAGNFDETARLETRGRLPASLALADINGDGRRDAVVAHSFSDDTIVIFYGDGGFTFSVSQEVALGESRDALEAEIRDLAVADFNGDGRQDIAAACHASSSVVVLMNTSSSDARDQSFSKETYKFEDGAPRALCAADLDQKGGPDLAVALWGANAVTLLLGK